MTTNVGSACFGGEDMIGSGAGTGAGADDILVGVVDAGACADMGVDDTAEGVGPDVIAPVSRLTRLGGAIFPEKNSDAERAGSSEGAGG